MTPEDEEALKVRYRAFTRRLGAGLALAGLFGVFFMVAILATVAKGFRPVFLWGPIAIALALGLSFFYKRRWGLAAVCAGAILFHYHGISISVEQLERARGEIATTDPVISSPAPDTGGPLSPE